jgi:outer membrane protein, multidrug efflux system
MTAIFTPKALRLTLLCLCVAAVTNPALAAPPPDGGLTDLQASMPGLIIGTQPGTVVLPRPTLDTSAEVHALLQKPLSADATVRIALLNNPDLQIAMGAAGTSISDAVRSDNPAKLKMRQAITVLSARAYKAWVSAVAAEQSVRLLEEAKNTLEVSGDLTRRMTQVGNVSKLTQARAQLALSESAVALARSRSSALAARENLTVVLGLWGAQARYQLEAGLPALPKQAIEVPDVEARALQARADMRVARAQWQLKQARATSLDADDLWDAVGDAAGVRSVAVKLRSQAREVYFAYRTAFDIARYLQVEVLPLRTFIHDELVLRYNGMLTSIFDVLADSQARTLTSQAAVMAHRDFWLAHADLQALLAGAPMEGLKSAAGESAVAAPGVASALH